MKHEEATERLGLAVSGGLSPSEDRELSAHVAGCASCRDELDALRELAGELERLPTPMPPPGVVEKVRRLVHLELASVADERLSTLVVGFLLAFSWTITWLSLTVFRWLTGGQLELLSLLSPTGAAGSGMGWSAAYLATGWLAGGFVVVVLALKFRKSRRFA